jgi:hypothetical protein
MHLHSSCSFNVICNSEEDEEITDYTHRRKQVKLHYIPITLKIKTFVNLITTCSMKSGVHPASRGGEYLKYTLDKIQCSQYVCTYTTMLHLLWERGLVIIS